MHTLAAHYKALRANTYCTASGAYARALVNVRCGRPLATSAPDRHDIHGSIVRTRDANGKRMTLVVAVCDDQGHDAPWDSEDGHGPVSEWTTRAKRAGELVLAEGRRDGAKRYYDFAAACAEARRDGWGSEPFNIEGETPRQKAARAAMADFNRLKGWCDDKWGYIGVALFLLDGDGAECDPAKIANAEPFGEVPHVALWGIESDAGDYFREVIAELTQQARTGELA